MAQTKSQRKVNLERSEQGQKAIKSIKAYLSSVGVDVKGLKHKALIRLYADKQGKIIPNGKKLKDWAVENVLGVKPIKSATKKSARQTATMKEVAEEFADENRKMPTPAEKYFKKLLKLSGFRFKTEKIIPKPPTFIIVDFYVPDRNLCIELDGGYHEDPAQKAKDIERDKYLEVRRYNVWRMTNEEAMALTKDDVIAKIKSFTPKERNIRIIPYEEPKFKQPKKKKWGNPKPRRAKKKSKPIKTDFPTLEKIAENMRRREKLRCGL